MKTLLSLCIALLAINSFADEGLWTFDNFPARAVKAKYGFSASNDWLKHAQLSSAHLDGLCSASFVSKTGIVMTNHHCLLSCLEQLSSTNDLVTSGFYAKKQSEEVKCPDIELSKLVEIKDVSKLVRELTKNAENYEHALKVAITKIEKDCSQNSASERCEVIRLYPGKQYNLYRYYLYDDVRLVFAPEHSIAFYGGYLDNFDFPRYGFDISFLRVYEKGLPIETKDFFRWSAKGATDGELSFVIGNPGYTVRLWSVAELEYARDTGLIAELLDTAELRGFLTAFQSRGLEQKRVSMRKLYSVENDLKGLKGRLASLSETNVIKKRRLEEKALRLKINASPKLKRMYGDAWDQIKNSYKEYKNSLRNLNAIEKNFFDSQLYRIARDLVSGASELPKASEAPIHEEFEIAMMTYQLTKMREKLGADHLSVKSILGQHSPEELANNLIKSTALKSKSNRTLLLSGGKTAIERSKDPMIIFAKTVDTQAMILREQLEKGAAAIVKKAKAKVEKAHFAVYGSNKYPEGDFTLRISYGTIKGVQKKDSFIKPFTTIQGAFDRHTGSEPFALPETWLNAVSKMNVITPLNFVSTNDVVGGNSGSPVLNKNAELIGIVFDGNIYALGGFYGYDQKLSRSVAVHSEAIIEVLKNVYAAERIVAEIRAN